MKYLKKPNVNIIIPSFLITLVFSIIFVFNTFAMGISISFADVNATVGDEVNLVMTLSSTDGNIDSANIMLSYDDSILEFVSGTNAQGGAGSIKVTSNTGNASNSQNYSLKFKAKNTGNATVVVSTWEVYDTDSKMAVMQSQGSGRVNIKEAEQTTAEESTVEKNNAVVSTVAVDKKDALLSSLKVSPGKLVPEFSSSVKNYDMSIAGNISNIAVNAKTRQEGAKIVITGNDNLVVGVNAITIKVTSPDGSAVESYIINVNKSENKKLPEESTVAPEEPVQSESTGSDIMHLISTDNGLRLNGIDYQVSDSFDKNMLPEGFEEATFTYKGRDVKAGKMREQDVYILYLVGNDGSGDFYIYDDETDTWAVYTQLSTNPKSITIMPTDEDLVVPRGFVESIININGKKIRGWIWSGDNEKRYCVVYAMNSDGRKDFYRYDMEERTIQRYFADPNVDTGVTTEEYNILEKKYNQTVEWLRNIIALSVILGIFIFVLLMLGTSKKKKVSKTVHKPAKKKNKSNITPKVDLIPEEEMNDESPLEYMPLSQKKEDEDKEEDDDIESDDFDEIDLSDNWLQSEKESEDFEDLDI
ncbi:cadherin-like beta sandwich domain-containing protein [Lachnoanaerobaculum sp. Marseille-Q4761]|jgi:putative cohesin domain protein|uniref:cadherin-like beta sandwich domain-containing protein n=1 Tax=Lachnoanaerobaculum sp. Marseille-Q4761 TaxID=2819511 RepID=UPI001AA1CD6E|nr:cadherin-like beta sandwich domain-containing protein [Lachnoanaerobaculum sp. Marseille-Q4761]MBO1871591.1 cadherin-like beta sandwich domain-containing protein [Lachnoanaerobaculum sp. Marseille-Q4761]